MLVLPLDVSAGSLWSLWPKSSKIELKLESYFGIISDESDGMIRLSVVYEFGETEDRIVVKAKGLPELDGKELFRGRIQSLALDWSMYEKTLKKMSSKVRERVEFFPSRLTRPTGSTIPGKKYDRVQAIHLFSDGAKTFILDYDHFTGLKMIEVDRIYERPSEVEVSHSYRESEMDYYVIQIRPQDRQIHFDTQEAREEIAKRERSYPLQAYYEKLLIELDKGGNEKALRALKKLTDRQNEILSEEDIEPLRELDRFLMSFGLEATGLKFITQKSNARSVGQAIESRLLLFGEEPMDLWAFKAFGKFGSSNKEALTFVIDGLLVSRLPFNEATFFSFDETKERLKISASLPSVGVAPVDHVDIIVDVGDKIFGEMLEEQIQRGIRGNSEYYKTLLDDVLQRRHECQNLLIKKKPL